MLYEHLKKNTIWLYFWGAQTFISAANTLNILCDYKRQVVISYFAFNGTNDVPFLIHFISRHHKKLSEAGKLDVKIRHTIGHWWAVELWWKTDVWSIVPKKYHRFTTGCLIIIIFYKFKECVLWKTTSSQTLTVNKGWMLRPETITRPISFPTVITKDIKEIFGNSISSRS